MRDAVAVIAEHLAAWETPFVELDIFGTADPDQILAAIDDFVRSTMRASIAGYLFQSTSISTVHGLSPTRRGSRSSPARRGPRTRGPAYSKPRANACYARVTAVIDCRRASSITVLSSER